MTTKTKQNSCVKSVFCVLTIAISAVAVIYLFSNHLINQRTFVKGFFKIILGETPARQEDVLNSDTNLNGAILQLQQSLPESNEHKTQNTSKMLLYRKRRYLQFPEGSSLQLVFNVLVPIIDYTNYAILGITCALAYELPSKPLSELEDELLKKLHKDFHGYPEQNPSLVENNHDPKEHKKDKLSEIIYIHPSEYALENSYHSPVYSNYNSGPYSSPYYYKEPIFSNNHYSSVLGLKNKKNSKFDSGNPFERSWRRSSSKNSHLRRQDEYHIPHQHAVYHIMGKRSNMDNPPNPHEENNNSRLNKLDQIHLRYHRSSRHTLYSKLEAMFDKQGKNGTECVLRALCETGIRRHETEPGDVVTEIFRAVFTLPRDAELNSISHHPMHRARDEAHWNQKNCSQTYPLCENFIWDRNFKI